jgi:hypothetical protein
VLTITIQELLLAKHFSETCLASCCCPGGNKSAASSRIKDTFDNPRMHPNGGSSRPSFSVHFERDLQARIIVVADHQYQKITGSYSRLQIYS